MQQTSQQALNLAQSSGNVTVKFYDSEDLIENSTKLRMNVLSDTSNEVIAEFRRNVSGQVLYWRRDPVVLNAPTAFWQKTQLGYTLTAHSDLLTYVIELTHYSNPFHETKGNWVANLSINGNQVATGQEGFPRRYFNLKIAALELEEYLKRNGGTFDCINPDGWQDS